MSPSPLLGIRSERLIRIGKNAEISAVSPKRRDGALMRILRIILLMISEIVID